MVDHEQRIVALGRLVMIGTQIFTHGLGLSTRGPYTTAVHVACINPVNDGWIEMDLYN
jgi:hypothetical protein